MGHACPLSKEVKGALEAAGTTGRERERERERDGEFQEELLVDLCALGVGTHLERVLKLLL